MLIVDSTKKKQLIQNQMKNNMITFRAKHRYNMITSTSYHDNNDNDYKFVEFKQSMAKLVSTHSSGKHSRLSL